MLVRRPIGEQQSPAPKVGAFAVSGGNLTELATSPFALPTGATPAGIVVS
jgi:hypothetical protein